MTKPDDEENTLLSLSDVAEMAYTAVDQGVQTVNGVAKLFGTDEDVAIAMYSSQVNGVYITVVAVGESSETNDAIVEGFFTNKYH